MKLAITYRNKFFPIWSASEWIAFFLLVNANHKNSNEKIDVYMPNDVYRAAYLHKLNGPEKRRKNYKLFTKPGVSDFFSNTGYKNFVVQNINNINDAVNFLSEGYKLIIKESVSVKGKGVAVWDSKCSIDNLNKLIASNKFAVQLLIDQHQDLDSFNTISRNTLRIMTLKKCGRVKVLTLYGRFGLSGKEIQDSVALGGLAVPMDLDGKLYGVAYDSNYKEYKINPINGIAFAGMSWPAVSSSINLCIKIHQTYVVHGVVGWDVLIKRNGQPIIIEANSDPGIILPQVMYGPFFSKRDIYI